MNNDYNMNDNCRILTALQILKLPFYYTLIDDDLKCISYAMLNLLKLNVDYYSKLANNRVQYVADNQRLQRLNIRVCADTL